MRAVVARAPTRIDFGGGWTDVPPYCDERGGCVCSVAIARYATARVATDRSASAGLPETAALADAAMRRAGLTDTTVTLANDFPIAAGLGGSSAAGVAIAAALAAWQGRSPSPAALAEESRAVEIEELHVAGGRQDHYAAAYGGALGLWFGEGGAVRVQRLALGAELAAEIARRCIVVYTGQSRVSGRTITAVLDAYRSRVPRVVGALASMTELAEQMVAALGAGALDDLGALVATHWDRQRSLHPEITTPLIDRVIAAAYGAGALGAKALGASGGGCVVAVAPTEGAGAVRAAMASEAALLPFTVDVGGVRVTDSD